MAAEQLYARIKPPQPKRGLKVRRYSVFGILFKAERGWYRIDSDIASYLRTVRQDNNDPDSKTVFDVATESEVKEITEQERRRRIKAGLPVDPISNAVEAKSADRKGEMKRAVAQPIGSFESTADAELGMDGRGDLTSRDVLPPARRPSESATGGDNPLDAGDELPTEDEATERVVPDDLTRIDGIGEATEQKLYEAGIETYAQIAGAQLATLTEIVGNRAKDIRKQARRLAG